MKSEEVLAGPPEAARDYLALARKKPWLVSDMFLSWKSLLNYFAEKPVKIKAQCQNRKCGRDFSITEIILGFEPGASLFPCPECLTKNVGTLLVKHRELFLFSPEETLLHTAAFNKLKDWQKFQQRTITLVYNCFLYFGGVYQAFIAMDMAPPVPRPQPPKNWLAVAQEFRGKLPKFWLAEAMLLNDEQLAQI